MEFSNRTSWTVGENRLAQTAAEKRRTGTCILDLTESNPTRCRFEYLSADLLEPLTDPKNLLYEPDPRGLPEARRAVCGYYRGKGVQIEPDQIFLTASTSEAYSFLFQLLAERGDAVLAPQPSYPLLDYLSGLQDIRLQRYPLVYRDGWKMETDALQRAFGDRPRALVLVHPNNPTGNYVTSQERKVIESLCDSENAAVISDEVFFDFPHDPKKEPRTSFAADPAVLSFTLSGISKILGLPQMKLSWIVVGGPPDLRRRAVERLEIIADTALSVNTPAQRALTAWLENRGRALGEISVRILQNKRLLEKKLGCQKDGEVLKSEGGWYAVLKIPSSLSDEEAAVRLLEEYDILVHPGYFFDFMDGCYLVLSLLPPAPVFEQGIDRLSEWFSASS